MTDDVSSRAARFGPSAVLTPANAITVARILAAPVAFVMMLHTAGPRSWALVTVWFVLSTTDLLDGRLARKYGATRSGAFLDPLADKVLAIGGLTCMWWIGRFPLVALAIVVVREVAISVFRSSFVSSGLAVPASKLAKWKTFLQLGAVGWVVLPPTHELRWLADITLWVGVVVGVVSGVQYLVAGRRSATAMTP